MAAYAALLSLARSLQQILDLDQHIDSLHKEKIISLHEKVDSVVNFLEDYSEKHRGTHGNEIRNAAHEAQDFMDSYLCSVSTTHDGWSSSEADGDEVSLDRCLDIAFERIEFIWEESILEMKNEETVEDLRSRTYSSREDRPSTVNISGNKVVGFDDDLNVINEQLYEDSDKLKVIPIVGMGGIGKTTLARRAYEDSLPAQHFDIFAWTTVSGEYQRRDTLLEFLQSFKKYTGDSTELSGKSEAQLAKLVYQNLKSRRYLIVIDDIWTTEAWDDLKMIFPDDGNGSRILLTTRQWNVAVYAGSSSSSIQQMKFLSEDQSWELLQEKIFGQESCPLYLVELGKKVARNCRGLPLTIVVVAGLILSSGNVVEEELWERVLEDISSTERTIPTQCSKILCLSYEWLPLRLKPCFLYIAAFPEDFEIDVSTLIMLWVAEGFLKPNSQFKCLEDVGKGYLEDLVNRNLILVSEKGPDGVLVSVGIHDLLRKFCMTKAEEEGFLHHVSSTRNACSDAINNPKRRLCLHTTLRLQESFLDTLRLQESIVDSKPFKRFQELRTQDSSVRSIFFDRRCLSILSPCLSRLSILNAPKVTWWSPSEEISTFVNLRYISFAIDHPHVSHPTQLLLATLSELPILETLIIHTSHELEVPYEFFMMRRLRHLIIDSPFYLYEPSNEGTIDESALQTLEIVTNFIITDDVIKILVNLKKLAVGLYKGCDDWDALHLNNLFRLQNLEELEVSRYDDYATYDSPRSSLIWNYAFPTSLKKLTLRGVPFPWENMTIIGSLQCLQVLEIVENEIKRESEWMPMEGQFPQLKYFCSSLDYLVKWEVEKDHLPSLESLILKRIKLIDEIPCGLGEVDSLQLIKLVNCEQSLVNSARRIEEQQHENGNYAFQVKGEHSVTYFLDQLVPLFYPHHLVTYDYPVTLGGK